MPPRKNNTKFVRLIQNQKNEEALVLPKAREKARNTSNLKQKTVIKPETSNPKWFQKKSFVRFELDTTVKKPMLPYPFAEEAEHVNVDEAFLIESHFGRRPTSKYLVPAEITLNQISERPGLTRSRSLYDPIVERPLDDSINNEDNNEKNVNTMTSIEDRKSRSQSMIFDTEMPLLRSKTYSSRKIRGSGIVMEDTSFEKTSIMQNPKIASLDNLLMGAQDERPIRRKSCTCSTCGLNIKLAKSSALFLLSELKNKSSLMQDDLLSVPKGYSKPKASWYSQHSGSSRELAMLIKLNRDQAKKKTQKKINISKRPSKKPEGENIKGSPSTTSQQSSIPSPILKKLGSVPDSPLFQYRRMESKRKMERDLNTPTLKEHSFQSGESNSPLLNHEMKTLDVQFLSKTVSNDQDIEQKSYRILKLMEKLPSQSDPENASDSAYEKNDNAAAWKMQMNPLEIAETSKEYVNTPEPRTQTHNSEEAKKHEPSRFSFGSNRPKISSFKQEAELKLGPVDDDDTANQGPTVNLNSRKIILIEDTLAKISAGSHMIATVDHRPSHNNFTMMNRVKTMHHDNTEPNLQTTDRSEKSINQTVNKVLAKTGKHRELIAALERSHQIRLNKDRKITPSPLKVDLFLPYLEYITSNSHH